MKSEIVHRGQFNLIHHETGLKIDFFRRGGSEKHLHDIRGMLAETPVDEAYIHSWIEKLGLAKEWGKVK